MTEAELNKRIDGLMKELNDLKDKFSRHTHNGFDSRREFLATKTLIYGDIEFPYNLSENGYAEVNLKTPLGFGINILESIGASQFGSVELSSQSSTLSVGGTGSNGGLTLTDTGDVAKYFKLAHSSGGTPVLQTDALPTSSAGLAAGTLWSDAGTVKITS